MGSKDPSQTTLLRQSFMRDVSKIFNQLARDVVQLIVEDDAFGLEKREPFAILEQVDNVTEEKKKLLLAIDNPPKYVVNALRRVYAFQTNPEKVRSFRQWLQQKIDEGILKVGPDNKPWISKYVSLAYRKGVIRAFTDVRRERKAGGIPTEGFDFREEFLRLVLARPQRVGNLELLATRAFELMEGVTAAMAVKLRRILADGLVRGHTPQTIARNIAKNIRGIDKQRALLIARTEIVHAHAEGQLDAFEDLGIEKVGALVEWTTAGDDRVCPKCAALEGVVMTVKDARGKIPQHPGCRCIWLPSIVENKSAARKRMLSRVRKVLKMEGGADKSTWAGKDIPGLREKKD